MVILGISCVTLGDKHVRCVKVMVLYVVTRDVLEVSVVSIIFWMVQIEIWVLKISYHIFMGKLVDEFFVRLFPKL
jgi:hypothetical protein